MQTKVDIEDNKFVEHHHDQQNPSLDGKIVREVTDDDELIVVRAKTQLKIITIKVKPRLIFLIWFIFRRQPSATSLASPDTSEPRNKTHKIQQHHGINKEIHEREATGTTAYTYTVLIG